MGAGLRPVAQIQAQWHKNPGTIQGQALQTCSGSKTVSGSRGHQDQLWSCAKMSTVALRWPFMTALAGVGSALNYSKMNA